MLYKRWRRARYAVPATVVVAIGGVALVPTLSGAAVPTLASLSAQQLVADMDQARVPELSGTLSWSTNLGLSDLSTVESELGEGPNTGSNGDSATSGLDPVSLLTSNYQLDIWLGGPGAVHLALSQSAGQESDLVRSGNQVWIWDSTGSKVTHFIFERPNGASAPAPSSATVGGAPELAPQQLAARFLEHVQPTTSVTVGTPLYVAGQPAYQLLFAPKSAAGTTVDHLEVDLGANGALLGVPLQVAVYAVGESVPAAQLGFTGSLSLGAPPASELSFTAPPGSNVTTHIVKLGLQPAPRSQGWGQVGKLGLSTVGSGWATVLSGTSQELANELENPVLLGLTTQVDVAGQQARLLSSTLLNVLVFPDGHFFAGFVTPGVLEADAAASP
ncbi:MAG TPA: hypothetical protein VME20_03020 [Acidimicrobiales bacterium]|nr:hypothetical protein [Acidimicrobiales bacterium]